MVPTAENVANDATRLGTEIKSRRDRRFVGPASEMPIATEDEVVVSYACEEDSYNHMPDVNQFSNQRFIRMTA